MNDLTPEQLSIHAKNLLDDPMVQEIFERLDRRYVQLWKNTPTPEAREACHAAVKALEDIKTQLQSFANNPKVEGFNRNLRLKHK